MRMRMCVCVSPRKPHFNPTGSTHTHTHAQYVNIHDSIKCESAVKAETTTQAQQLRQPGMWQGQGVGSMRCKIIYYISSEANKTFSSSFASQP